MYSTSYSVAVAVINNTEYLHQNCLVTVLYMYLNHHECAMMSLLFITRETWYDVIPMAADRIQYAAKLWIMGPSFNLCRLTPHPGTTDDWCGTDAYYLTIECDAVMLQ